MFGVFKIVFGGVRWLSAEEKAVAWVVACGCSLEWGKGCFVDGYVEENWQRT